MTAWVLRANDTLFVSDSFRHAMRTVAALVIPDEEQRLAEKHMDRFPDLSAVGAQGSFYQHVRNLGSAAFNEKFVLEEHQLNGRPGLATTASRLDMRSDPDPSFEVQKALWRLASGEASASVGEMARLLEGEVHRGIEEAIGRASAEEVVASIISFEDRFQGLAVVSRFGRPRDILDAAPSDASRVFSTAAKMAFPKS